jgi:hypothetical protein
VGAGGGAVIEITGSLPKKARPKRAARALAAGPSDGGSRVRR